MKTEHKVRWQAIDGAGLYRVYRSDLPGGPYSLVTEVAADPAKKSYSLAVEIEMIPSSLTGSQIGQGAISLSWSHPPLIGAPQTFKIKRDNEPSPSSDISWKAGLLPAGSFWERRESTSSSWSFGPGPSEKIVATEGFSLSLLNSPDTFLAGHVIVWVWVEDPPETLWFEFHDGEKWSKAIYYGLDLFFSQAKGIDALYFGEIPPTGSWIPLVIPLSRLGLSKSFGIGLGAGARSGQASVYVGPIFCSPEPVWTADLPHPSLKGYKISRDGEDIGFVFDTSFVDHEAWPEGSYGQDGPVFQIFEHDDPDKALLRWSNPLESGSLQYEVTTIGYNRIVYGIAIVDVAYEDRYGYAEIFMDEEPIVSQAPLGQTNGFSFLLEDLEEGPYHLLVKIYDKDDHLLYTKEMYFTPFSRNLLDHFVLDYGHLG